MNTNQASNSDWERVKKLIESIDRTARTKPAYKAVIWGLEQLLHYYGERFQLKGAVVLLTRTAAIATHLIGLIDRAGSADVFGLKADTAWEIYSQAVSYYKTENGSISAPDTKVLIGAVAAAAAEFKIKLE